MAKSTGFECPPGENPGDGNDDRARSWTAAAAALLSTGILATDLQAPPCAAVGIAYGVPIFLVSRFAPALILPSAAITTLLAVGPHLFWVQSSASFAAMANLALVLCVIWGLALILKKASSSEISLRREVGRLQHHVAGQRLSLDRTADALARNESLVQLGRQAAIVAHELRNPLGVIATSLHLVSVKTGRGNLEIEAAVARATRALGRCEKIIADHLDLARAGQRHRPVQIDGWLSKLLDELSLPEAVTLRQELNAKDRMVLLDTEAMRRALINLVDNACQAMLGDRDDGQDYSAPAIVVSSHSDETGVEVSVSDNGPGIAAGILPRLPEPLFSTKPSGTGLGLVAVKRILEEHSGSLLIASEPGAGARVTLRLPLHKP